MKINKIAAIASATALLAGIGTFATQGPASAQAPFLRTHPMIRAHREAHPELRRALRQLELARTSLQAGAHDFQGHREHALDLVNQAIVQLRQAIASDRH